MWIFSVDVLWANSVWPTWVAGLSHWPGWLAQLSGWVGCPSWLVLLDILCEHSVWVLCAYSLLTFSGDMLCGYSRSVGQFCVDDLGGWPVSQPWLAGPTV